MARKFISLHTTRVPKGINFTRPPEMSELLHLSDPALSAMIDLKYTKPLVISHDKRMYDARMMMQAKNNIHRLHLIFVVNDDERLVGFLSLEKIMTEFPIKLLEKKRVNREDLLVKDVMRPVNKVCTIHYGDLKLAKVGDIVETFNKEKQHYALVLETDKQSLVPMIRGIFLASRMSALLRMDIISQKLDRAQSIAELNHILQNDYIPIVNERE